MTPLAYDILTTLTQSPATAPELAEMHAAPKSSVALALRELDAAGKIYERGKGESVSGRRAVLWAARGG